MRALLFVAIAFAWWGSAYWLYVDDWTLRHDLTREDRWLLRGLALGGPVAAVVIWLAGRVEAVARSRPDEVVKPRKGQR